MRVRDGSFRKDDPVLAMATGRRSDIEEVGIFSPDMQKTDVLRAGGWATSSPVSKKWPTCGWGIR